MASVRFGACVLDLDARRLVRSGEPLHVSPKAFELLKILVSEQPRAISKAELHDRIWPGTFVTDDSLSKAVAEARNAIGDSSRAPTFLRTVHGFGYAFSGSVTEGDSTSPSAESTGWLLYGGRAAKLSGGTNVIGREPSVDVVLDSIRVSRRHAQVTVFNGSATLEDLASRNGTWVNGARITSPVVLADGDKIAIGEFALKYRSSGDASTTEIDD